MESSTISFEKIPLISKDNPAANEVHIAKLDTIYSINQEGAKIPKGKARTISTNTGPDIMFMLDNLKREVLPKIKEHRRKNNYTADSNIDLKASLNMNKNIMNDNVMREIRRRNINRRSAFSMSEYNAQHNSQK